MTRVWKGAVGGDNFVGLKHQVAVSTSLSLPLLKSSLESLHGAFGRWLYSFTFESGVGDENDGL